MAEDNTYQSQASERSNKLWAIANDLRGNMDASKFKNYFLQIFVGADGILHGRIAEE